MAGSINTVLTYLIYYVAVVSLGYAQAFSLAFVFGAIFSYIFYCIFVFKARIKLSKFYKYPLLYLMQYLAGLIVLTILIRIVGIDMKIAPIFNVAITMPVTFFLNRWFFLRE
ncbi:GtrA family protein [Polynucleobacter sp. AP-Kolm-20A-A1]|uniref:GtrA family protein n=1 Tax=Polynucleobacter sp. AP-Kolm-20A-A1 TaxID=2081041 RepID=UPI001BFCEAFC|nr:GtrA family protein [Polynucleobacter sp. AP-Kolm-20A-A1]